VRKRKREREGERTDRRGSQVKSQSEGSAMPKGRKEKIHIWSGLEPLNTNYAAKCRNELKRWKRSMKNRVANSVATGEWQHLFPIHGFHHQWNGKSVYLTDTRVIKSTTIEYEKYLFQLFVEQYILMTSASIIERVSTSIGLTLQPHRSIWTRLGVSLFIIITPR